MSAMLPSETKSKRLTPHQQMFIGLKMAYVTTSLKSFPKSTTIIVFKNIF